MNFSKFIKNNNKLFNSYNKILYNTNKVKIPQLISTTNYNNNNKCTNIKGFNDKRLFTSTTPPPPSDNNNNNNNKKDEDKDNKDLKKEDEKDKESKIEEVEEEEDDVVEDDEYSDNKYGILLGTDKTDLILEDNENDDPIYNSLINHMQIRKPTLRAGNGLAANLTFLEYFQRYLPKRNTPMESPYFNSSLLANELFNYNPFLLILPHPRYRPVPVLDYLWKFSPPIFEFSPLGLNKDEFLENSVLALKQIYRWAKEENSKELQEISCLPAAPRLMIIRDSYYSAKKNESGELNFTADDLDIDHFDFKPIGAIPLDYKEGVDKILKIEVRYRVTSEKYKINQSNFPVNISVFWISPTDEFDWRILDLSYETKFDIN